MKECLEIGTPEQIASRRDIVDIEVFLKNQVRKCDGFNRMDSGSEREGFRLLIMYCPIGNWIIKCSGSSLNLNV